ncbi:hypothetical protein N9089_01970 [Crocinitomicaceae bacterium]|nr:hypothetical protein [Crocinitomicaceae bacterium]
MDHITVSPHPTLCKKPNTLESLRSYDIVLNVSDHLDPELTEWLLTNRIQSYWLPLGEAYVMPLENIYGALLILWRAERDEKNVLIHCIAGRNRSRMTLDCYRYMMTGEYSEDSAMMLNVKDSQLPGIYRLEVFLQKCLEVFERSEVAGGAFDVTLADWVKREALRF